MTRPRPRLNAVAPALAVLLGAGAASAQEPAPPRWQALASLWTVSPSALSGFATGLSLQAHHRPGAGPWVVSARFGWTATTQASRDWEIRQQEPSLALLAGAQASLGVGTVRAQLGADTRLVWQRVARAQAPRLEALGVEGVRHSNWTASPGALAEASVALDIAGPWRVELGGGPRAALVRVNAQSRLAWGGQIRVGAGYAF